MKIVHFSDLEYHVCEFVLIHTVPPNITVPPESVITETGLPVFLDCIAFGLPTPSLVWLKDGSPLVQCTPELLSSGRACVGNDSVIIQSADEDDTGRYTCIAESSAGIAVYEAFVAIETATCKCY